MTRRHIFISHHHADDPKIDQLTGLLRSSGNDVRNSSVRLKPENQKRIEEGRISSETIKRLLRMKISWSSTVVVLIGHNTHTRPWVNWEIEQAARQGKRIVGVYTRGGMDAEKPEALEKYSSAVVAWNAASIIDAIEGKNNKFENSDGTTRAAVHPSTTRVC